MPRALIAVTVAVFVVTPPPARADSPVPRTTQRSFTNSDLAASRPATAPRDVAAGEIVVDGSGEAAVAQPTVPFTLRNARGTLTAPKDALGDLLGAVGSGAIVDTGASGHLLSAATAQALGVGADHSARYVETGVSGEHAMGVSDELELVLGPDRGTRTFRAQRFLLNDAPSDPNAMLVSPGSFADVVGMPAIREVVVVIETRANAAPIEVRLADAAPAVDAWIATPLIAVGQRHHPKNRGALPTLAPNPMIRDVRVHLGTQQASGDWLLDTGSAVTMISTHTAAALGLATATGTPLREPAFRVPVGGIGGGNDALPGYLVDRIELAASGGGVVAFAPAAVVVHDVSLVGDDGSTLTLDGVLGMNLLLPSGSGLGPLGFTHDHPSPFGRVVIDGPRARLGLAR